MAIANFNPLTPMPGTGLYDRLEAEGGLLRPNWWIDPSYAYGDAIFQPKKMTAAELRDGPMEARRAFYSWSLRWVSGFSTWTVPRARAAT